MDNCFYENTAQDDIIFLSKLINFIYKKILNTENTEILVFE